MVDLAVQQTMEQQELPIVVAVEEEVHITLVFLNMDMQVVLG
jgi:hypothetical protein